MNVVLLGAGASKSYEDSTTGVKMPIAKDFFETFRQLSISENPWVLIGDVLNYLRDHHNKPWIDFLGYSEDIETLHSEVEGKLKSIKNGLLGSPKNMSIYKTYVQLIFIFCSMINEIQNGKTSISHLNLAKVLSPSDVILTFNWDTLMDRALSEAHEWDTSHGYLVKPSMIYRNAWKKPKPKQKYNAPLLLKLHGSTNWLTSHFIPEGNRLSQCSLRKKSDSLKVSKRA